MCASPAGGRRSSPTSREDPANYAVNKEFSASGNQSKTIFIPAIWFHMLVKVTGVAVDVFWRKLEDPHGNKGHLSAAKALRMLEKEMK